MVVSQLRPNAVTDPRLLAAMGTVAREAFLPDSRRNVAYADRPVPLTPSRSLNPPLTTARLLDALKLVPGDRLLIVGAASGYSAAIAADLCDSVVAVEEDAALVALSQDNSITNAPLAAGAPDAAPFDAILVDGAVEAVPEGLVAQLAPGGRLSCGIVKDGVTRLSLGRKGGNSFALVDFADAEVVVLPGFALKREFVF